MNTSTELKRLRLQRTLTEIKIEGVRSVLRTLERAIAYAEAVGDPGDYISEITEEKRRASKEIEHLESCLDNVEDRIFEQEGAVS